MTKEVLDKQAVEEFVNYEIVRSFHNLRLAALEGVNLYDVLKKKNPYLFRAKNIQTASELIGSMLDARLSSSEEKIFGDFLEKLAIFVSQQTSNGRKSSAKGIDLEFDREDTLYLVSIKSGPNWGNSSQYQALRQNFQNAIRVQRQADRNKAIRAILGICYGKTRTTDNGAYIKITGQNFWHFVSDDEDLYAEIIEPIGHYAHEHNEAFTHKRNALEEKLMAKFTEDFCDDAGNIDWDKLIQFNSGNYKE